MKRITVRDLVASAVILICLAAALAPVMATVQRSAAEARCQSNMRRWAQAMDLYVRDYQERYPTNRMWMPGSIPDEVKLTPLGFVDQNGVQIIFMYGINWVEALYSHLTSMAKRTGQDWQVLMRCPSASSATYPSSSSTARMTYTFNANLAEQPVAIASEPAKLMMLREADRRVNALLRPGNNCTGSDVNSPKSPFLNSYDWRIKETNPSLHANGSYIVFADGHVRWFSTDYFPEDPAYSNKAQHWDAQTQRWYNWVYLNPANDTERALDRSIAISP